MNSEILRRAESELERRRLNSKLKYESELNFVLSHHEELASLFAKRKNAVCDFSCGKEKRKENIRTIDLAIEKFLAENSLSLPKQEFSCTKCNDEGYILSSGAKERCSCLTSLIIELSSKDSYCDSVQNFGTFDIDVFDDEVKPEIKRISDYALAYSSAFPDVKRENIVFCGHTGTGKTFLLNCICNELRKRGFSVMFLTASKAFETLRKYAFGEISDIDALIECDLLILDDLGTEPLFNNITVEYLFMLINERTRCRKAICVSTNLSPEQFAERYTDRVSSRLFDKNSSYVFNLSGDDLRRKK